MKNTSRITFQLLKNEFQNLQLKDISTIRLEKYKNKLLAEGLTPATATHCLAIFRSVFKKMVSWGKYKELVPTDQISMPKKDNRRFRFLTKNEADELLTAIRTRSEDTYLMSLTSLHTGMRFGEVASLRAEHVSLKDGMIRIVDGKGESSRTVFMTTELRYPQYSKNLSGIPMSNNQEQNQEIAKTVSSMADSIHKLTDHFCKKESWYIKLGVKNITIIIVLVFFLFTAFEFRDTYTKFQQRSRMVQSIANTALKLSQDSYFRQAGTIEKEKVIDSLLADARQLAPQDPDLLSVQIYSLFMRKVRNPKEKDLMLMDAYLQYFNRLRDIGNKRSFLSKIFEIKNEQIITPGKFLQKLYYIAAATFLSHQDSVKNNESFSSLLLNKSDGYIRSGIKVCQEEKDEMYESILWALRAQYILKASSMGLSYQGDINKAFLKAQTFFTKFRNDENENIQFTGYDGSANICYLRAKYLMSLGKNKEATAQLNESLKIYNQSTRLWPEKVNTTEIKKVKALLFELSK